ncbi:hypothetical protein BH10PSE17_BH10PSE17_00740 [soil metagenome]
MTLPMRSREEADLLVAARGRQILFYAADGLLGGVFTCPRCGAAGRQPDVIQHWPECHYRAATPAFAQRK